MRSSEPGCELVVCTWTPEIGYSPDRLDAMVWGPHHLKLVHLSSRGKGTIGTDAARQQIAPGHVSELPRDACC